MEYQEELKNKRVTERDRDRENETKRYIETKYAHYILRQIALCILMLTILLSKVTIYNSR